MKEKELTLDEIREVQLSILDGIDSFCRNNDLRYSLAAGSLLGAVRHHGYIPWDDDIDIMMPRPDYEKFIKDFIGYKSNLILQDSYTDSFHYLPWAKVYDNRTELYSSNSVGGVYVDVFPIDGLPDLSHLSDYYRKVQALTDQLWFSMRPNYKYVNDNHFLLKVKVFVKHIIYPSRKKVISKWESFFNTFPFDKSNYAGEIISIYGMKEHLPKCVFDHYIDLSFEGKSYKCIKEYDTYLSKLYGDYMTLPPVEERVSHHHQTVFWKNSL